MDQAPILHSWFCSGNLQLRKQHGIARRRWCVSSVLEYAAEVPPHVAERGRRSRRVWRGAEGAWAAHLLALGAPPRPLLARGGRGVRTTPKRGPGANAVSGVGWNGEAFSPEAQAHAMRRAAEEGAPGAQVTESARAHSYAIRHTLVQRSTAVSSAAASILRLLLWGDQNSVLFLPEF